MHKTLIIIAIACLAAAGAAWAQSGPTAQQVGQDAKTAVDTRVGTQKAYDSWADERAKLRDDAETLQRELELAERQCKKSEAYLAGQKAKVADLEGRLREIERIRAELEPFLDETMERLDKFVAADTPFLAKERHDRLASLKAKLDDYDASLALKASRVLEALYIEAQYGGTVEVKEEEMALEGSAKGVRVLRLGRLGLYALGLDGRTAWRFDRPSGQWTREDDFARELGQAADMAARTRVISLVELPVGQAPAKEARP